MRRHLHWLTSMAGALCIAHALAAPNDDLLHREALKSDQRMFDNLQAFAKALRVALGSEPKLAALEVSENTGSALVRADDGQTRSFTLVEGKLTEARNNLRDEAPTDQALTGRFTFDAIDLDRVRAALKRQRARAGHIGDTAPQLGVRYRTIVSRWIVSIELGSLAIGNGLDLVSYDFRTGEPVDLKDIVARRNVEVEAHNTRVRAEQQAYDDEQKRLQQINMLGLGAEAVQALTREVGAVLYLRNVVVEVEQIRLTLNDPRARGETVTYRYNRAKKLTRMDKREPQVTKCEEPFPADEFNWPQVPQYVEQALVALGADRSAEIRVDVERPDKCGPVHAQVSLDKNHNINGAYFDRGGRLYRVE